MPGITKLTYQNKLNNSPLFKVEYQSFSGNEYYELHFKPDFDQAPLLEEFSRRKIHFTQDKHIIHLGNQESSVIIAAWILKPYIDATILNLLTSEDNFTFPREVHRPYAELVALAKSFKSLSLGCRQEVSSLQSTKTISTSELAFLSSLNNISIQQPLDFYLLFSDIMKQSLYGGPLVTKSYYGHNNSQFQESYHGGDGDFSTFASQVSGKAMAVLLAIRYFSCWIAKDCPKKFVICEAGAGNGNLAFETLTFLKKMAVEFDAPCWNKFWEAIRYQILEISPQLSKVQEKINQKFIEEKKLFIIQTDATKYSFDEPVDIFSSNELVDALPYEHLVHTISGEICAVVKVPIAQLDDIKLNQAIIDNNKIYQDNIKKFFNNTSDEINNNVIVDPETLAKQPELKEVVKFVDLLLNIKFIPGLKKLDLEQLRQSLPINKPTYMNIGALSLINNLRGKSSEIILIDYGASVTEIKNKTMRLYPEAKLANMFDKGGMLTWGKHDITADVDFTSLYQSLSSTYQHFEYGPQASVLCNLDNIHLLTVLKFLVNDPNYLKVFLVSFYDFLGVKYSPENSLCKHFNNSQYPAGILDYLINSPMQKKFKCLIASQPTLAPTKISISNLGPLTPNDVPLEKQVAGLAHVLKYCYTEIDQAFPTFCAARTTNVNSINS